MRHKILLIEVLVAVVANVPQALIAADPKAPAAAAAPAPAISSPSADGNSGNASADADFRRLFGEWQATMNDAAKIKIKFDSRTTPPDQQGALFAQINELIKKAHAQIVQLQAAAEKAYAADANNHDAGDLLLSMAVSSLRKDEYDQALSLAKFLIDHQYPGSSADRVAASAALAEMQLDDAQKYLLALGPQAAADSGVAKTLSEINKYRPKWDREQKLRAAEAKADDLPRVKLKTSQGEIVVELFENEAPNTVANFINLVDKGFYDGMRFHRVLPGFMAQVGDPLSKDPKADPATIGSGGPGYTIPDECFQPNHREHFRGSLSMAHTDQPNSGGSQFFLCFAPTEQLDGKYTVFGRVIDGLDVLAKLQRIDPDKEKQHPSGVMPDEILKAEAIRKRDHAYVPKTLAEKRGG